MVEGGEMAFVREAPTAEFELNEDGEKVKVLNGERVRVYESRAERILGSWFDVQEISDLEEGLEGVVEVVDALLRGAGPAAGIVSSDIRNNLRKIKLSAESFGVSTVADMVKEELKHDVKLEDSGREALLWLKRTLQFCWRTIDYILEDPEDQRLSRCLKQGYNDTLASCHGLRSHAFRLLMNGAPSKSEFFRRMGAEDEIVIMALSKWVDLSHPVIAEYVDICNEINIEDKQRCREF